MRKVDFSKKIVEWYQSHHRNLPWRNTPDPYKIWLSEIILQQTRVAQGLPYYQRFVKRYPTIKSLAGAKERDVLRLWQGLGYYSRARNLHRCAKEIVKDHKGKFPQTFQDLQSLPGIGVYTAAAIASFAFHERIAVVDGNVYRVLSRIFGIDHDIASPAGRKYFNSLANELISVESPGLQNQAIMEFGALQCVPKNPDCEDCLFMKTCRAFHREQVALLPVKSRKQKAKSRFFNYWVIRKGKKILMNPRTGKDIWKGMFDFPMDETDSEKQFRKSPALSGVQAVIDTSREFRHILTHQVITARFHQVAWPDEKPLPNLPRLSKARWFTSRQIEKLPKPVLIARYLEESGIL